jgi:tRNA threonylcarbamoyladenosine biosynthesis protein TsaE
VPILREGELDIISVSAEQTARLGQRLGALLLAGDVICLSGDMGAGKTVFSAGIGKGWGALDSVASPTFNLVHQHRRSQDRQLLYHLDCYRLRGTEDLDSIGFDDLIDTRGILVIEWAERIVAALPHEHLWIHLRVIEETRRNFIFEAVGKRYETLVEQFRAQAFGF